LKTYRYLFEELIKEDGIKQDILNSSLGKRDAWYVKKHTGDLSKIDVKTQSTKEIEKTIENIKAWLANYLLQPLDHYIKQEVLLDVKHNKELKYKNRMKRKGIADYKTPKYLSGADHYIRYMDDMVVFGNNKKELHLILGRINKFLNEKLGLRLKEDWQIFKFDYTDKEGNRKGRDLDFMGFKFYRDKTILRKSILIRATRKAKKLYKKDIINWYDASSMLSYIGWINNTDTYNIYLEQIKPYINIKYLKSIVSKHSKELSKIEKMAN